jgi:transposase
MEIRDHLPLSELKRLERSEKDANRARRLRIVILGLEGWTAPAVALAVGLSRRICQRWARRYNEHGLPGLEDQRGREPRGPLTPEQESEVRRRIEAGPTERDEVCSLRGKDLQRILAEEFGVIRSLAATTSPGEPGGSSHLRARMAHRAGNHRGGASREATASLFSR